MVGTRSVTDGTSEGRAPGTDPGGGAIGEYPVHINAFRQWWALTVRGITKVARNGEFILAVASPVLLAVCFYIPLRKLMDSIPGVNYGQFLMPIIILQSVSFAASSAAMRAAYDAAEGINTRFRVLPMSSATPMLARTATNGVLLAESLACAAIACLLMGWRPQAGVTGTVTLFAVAAAIGLLLGQVADGVGMVASSPQATSQALALPTLILGMLSTGFLPLQGFPTWIQPFVRNQPISQFTNVMRAADQGTLTWQKFQPTLFWWIGLIVASALLLWIHGRRVAR
ncbi:ABC transporter permease [Gordonia sp. NPDC003424]